MTPAADATDAEWALSRMRDRTGVAWIVPDCFPAVVRIMHPLTADNLDDGGRPVRWADALPDYLNATSETPFSEQLASHSTDDGILDRSYIDLLLPYLTAETTTPDDAYFGLWKGFGGLSAGSTAGMFFLRAALNPLTRARLALQQRQQRRRNEGAVLAAQSFVESCVAVDWWGGREMALMTGPLSAIDALGGDDFGRGVDPLGPQWWWPKDRAWFMGNEIDDAWTYLAGSRALIDQVLMLAATGAFEGFQVSFSSRS